MPIDISALPKITESIIECNNWTSIPSSEVGGPSFVYVPHVRECRQELTHVYSVQYKLPANESLYVHTNLSSNATPSQIPPIQGFLQVSVSPNASQHSALITVSAKDIIGQDLHNFNVCKIQTNCGWGVAIYVRYASFLLCKMSNY